MTSTTGIPFKLSRLVTEAQGAIFKIAEAIQAMHERKPIQGRYLGDDLETVWDRVAVALNEASGYGVVLNLSVRSEHGLPELPPSDAVRVRFDIPARLFQSRETSRPEKLLPNRLSFPSRSTRGDISVLG
jgi:hypothetical protein